MARVLIDGRMIAGQPHGIGRYVSRLAEGLALLAHESKLPYEPVFLRTEAAPATAFSGLETVTVGAKFLGTVELATVPLAARRARASLFHSPSFVGFSGASLGCPWVITIHDLIHLESPGFARKLYYDQLVKPFAMKAAARVTVSEFSKGELARWLGDAPIDVVPNALGPELLEKPSSETILEKLGLERGRFFFCLSNPKPHKNVDLLLEAYSLLPEPRFPLVLGGVTPLKLVPGVRAARHLSDEDCRALWDACAAFAFPSKSEGFGLPPAEAAVAGAALLVSSIEPLREALAPLGEGARVEWLDPGARDAWTRALERAGAEVGRQPLPARRRLLEAFSVRKLGQAMDRIYRRVLELPS